MSRHIPRLFVDQALSANIQLELPPPQVHHLVNVLRLQTEDAVILFNGQGGEYTARVLQTSRKAVRVQVDSHQDCHREPRLPITLAQGIARGERMDIAIQKAVELGVHTIQPLQTVQSQKLPADRLAKKLTHWQAIAQSATEQSGRCCVPPVQEVMSLNDWLDQSREPDSSYWVLDPEASQGLAARTAPTSCCLLIGPESGLTEPEIKLAVNRGFERIRLGPRILRTETAGMAAIATIQSLWGDLGT